MIGVWLRAVVLCSRNYWGKYPMGFGHGASLDGNPEYRGAGWRDGRLDGRANGSSEVAAAGKGAVVLGLEPKKSYGRPSFVCCCDAEGFVRGRTKINNSKK